MPISWKGSFKRKTKHALRLIEEASGKGVKDVADTILEVSQTMVPVDTGKLRASGFTNVEKLPSGPVAVAGYAEDGDPHYAIIVHENQDLRHKAPTQHSLLLEGMQRTEPDMEEIVAKRIRKVLR